MCLIHNHKRRAQANHIHQRMFTFLFWRSIRKVRHQRPVLAVHAQPLCAVAFKALHRRHDDGIARI